MGPPAAFSSEVSDVVLGLWLLLLALVGGSRLLLVLLKGVLLLLLLVQLLLLEVAVGLPPPVLLLLLVLLAVGVELLVLPPVVQPYKATARTTTRTAAWKTEALIVFILVFIFGLPFSFAIHPPRGGDYVQCRKG